MNEFGFGGAHPRDLGKWICHYAFPTPYAPSLLRLHVLLWGTVRPRLRSEPPLHLHQGHGAHARATEGGGRAGRGPAIPQVCCRERLRVRLEWGGVRPCVRQRGHYTPFQPRPHSLSVHSSRGLEGRLPREHGAPYEDFGPEPRKDKGVGDGDTSVTTDSGRGRRGRIAAGTPARAQRQLCGSSGAGWEASITRRPPGEPQVPYAASL